MTDFSKVVVGRLRPNFLDVCKPSVSVESLCRNVTYLTPEIDFKCLNYDQPQIMESRKSFPSGHASLSFYSMTFLVLFIHHTWKFRHVCGLFMPRFVQFFLLLVAVYATVTRSVDNKHHASDLVCGVLLGLLMGALTFFFLTDLPRNNISNNKKKRFYDEEDEYDGNDQEQLYNYTESGSSTSSSNSNSSRSNSSGCILINKNNNDIALNEVNETSSPNKNNANNSTSN